MALSSPVADLLTRMRNALQAKKKSVYMSSSKKKVAVLEVFKKGGYIEGYNIDLKAAYNQQLEVVLKYQKNGAPAILELGMISKPSRKIYVDKDNIPFIRNGLGMAVLSVSKKGAKGTEGMINDKKARKEGLGGKLICYVS